MVRQNYCNASSCTTILSLTLTDEIDDAEFLGFAIEYFSEMMGYVARGNANIRIRKYITDEM